MRTRRALALMVAVPALTTLVACGNDAERAEEAPVADLTTEPTTAEPLELGDADLLVLSGQEICAALSVDEATLAIGTEVSQAEASDSDTPQCTYTYGGDSANLSTLTVAVQRPEDVGGRGLSEAFDYVLDANRALAVEAGIEGAVEEAEVDAGDRGTRLIGDTLTLTVVASGGRLLTIITTPDLDSAAVEALSAAAADAVE